MRFCGYCGGEYPDETLTCPSDGHELQSGAETSLSKGGVTSRVTCKRCGAETRVPGLFVQAEGTSYCPVCFQRFQNRRLAWTLSSMVLPGPLGLVLVYAFPDFYLGYLAVNLFFFQLSLVVSILPHELGHAWAARILGWRVFKVIIGTGRKAFSGQLFGFPTELRILPLNGVVVATPKKRDHLRVKTAVFALAGPAVNLALVLAVWYWLGGNRLFNFDGLGTELQPFRAFAFANLVVLLMGLYPRTFHTAAGETYSDGLWLWRAFRITPAEADELHAARFAQEALTCHEQGRPKDAPPWLEKGLRFAAAWEA